MGYLLIAVLIYIILFNIIFAVKKKAKSRENTLYSVILFVTLLGCILDIVQYYFIYFDMNSSIITILNHTFLIYIIFWTFLFTTFVFNISKDLKKSKAFDYISLLVCGLGVIGSLFFPIEYIHNGSDIYTRGAGVNIIFVFVSIFITLCLTNCVTNFNFKNIKKYGPLFIFIILGFVTAFVQYLNPALLLNTPSEVFVVILTYFFLENPDVRLVELERTEKERALKLSESKTNFLSSMSKELRTPLNSIVGLSEDLELNMFDVPDEVYEDAKDINSATNTLIEIIGSILDISKIEGGKMEINPSDYEPKLEFETLAKIMRTKVNEKPLEFNVSISDKIPEVLYGDRVRIKQIINNFLSNAIKYTEKGHVDFSVEWYDASQSLFIKVSDTGRGVKPEDLDRLFAKYDRLSVEKVSSVQGTGLGLAITKELIEFMGGNVKVESTFGVGTSFMATIPQKLGDKVRLEETRKSLNVDLSKLNIEGKKVLIVDDNQLNIKVLKKTLKPLKLVIDECYNGKEAIEKVEINNYDLVLMDVGMPVMNGDEAFKIMKLKPEFKTPVICLTADAMTGVKERYLEMGFDEYIAKPVTREIIVQKLAKVFREEDK